MTTSKRCPRHRSDIYNASIIQNGPFNGPMDVPTMEAVEAKPSRLIPFSYAMSSSCRDFDAFVDFYEDDSRIERIWQSPEVCAKRLSKFAGVISPDFSTCRDFPVLIKGWNLYRNQAIGSFLQRQGLLCVPNVRCEPNLPWMLHGTPQRSTIAIGARACIKNVGDRTHFVEAVRYAIDTLRPTSIIWYGGTSYDVLSYPLSLGIPVEIFPGRIRGILGRGGNGQV